MLPEINLNNGAGNKIKTIIREVPGDLETPISVYLKLRDNNPSFYSNQSKVEKG